MTRNSRSKSRTNEGITLTISVRAKNEKAAKRMLEHPSVKRLLEAFESKHDLGGQDKDEKRPFARCTREDFLEDVFLRSRAIKWLEVQYNLEDKHPEKVVNINIPWRLRVEGCIFDLIASNLPELAAVYQMMAAGVYKNRKGLAIRHLERFGYKGFARAQAKDYKVKMSERMNKTLEENKHRPEIENIMTAISAFEGEAFASVNLG